MREIRRPRNQPERRSFVVTAALAAAVCVIIIGALLTTLLIQQRGGASNVLAAGKTFKSSTASPSLTPTKQAIQSPVVTATPQPPRNVPPPPPTAPPPAHPFSYQQNAVYAAATPCPIPPLPATVLGPGNGPTNEATPSATATPTTPPGATPTSVPTTSAAATPTATELPVATIPPCGSGQPYGPRCSSPLPGIAPTVDQVRQELYAASVSYGMSFSLIEAIAWQESGWTQNVVACDGGVGTMQLMPDTTKWLNQYYGTKDDPYDLHGNVHLGVGLLRYLYLYYLPFCNQGMPAGQTCLGETVWPGATDGATLRDILVSAYNEGAGTMSKYGIINWWYVNSVTALRKQFLAAQ